MLNMKVATRESLRLGLLTSTPGPPLSSLSPVLYLQLPFSTCLTLPTPASTISLPIQHPPEALHNPPLFWPRQPKVFYSVVLVYHVVVPSLGLSSACFLFHPPTASTHPSPARVRSSSWSSCNQFSLLKWHSWFCNSIWTQTLHSWTDEDISLLSLAIFLFSGLIT